MGFTVPVGTCMVRVRARVAHDWRIVGSPTLQMVARRGFVAGPIVGSCIIL